MSDNNAKEQAIAQANSVAAMVAALNVDYDRLEELLNERSAADSNGEDFSEEDNQEIAELGALAGSCTSQDEARERIQEDALDVQVRSDWYSPGNGNYGDSDSVKPREFMILLCTGGPAVRIMGELDEHMQPSRAWIEAQDWGTPWQHVSGIIEQDILLSYCQQFYFGE